MARSIMKRFTPDTIESRAGLRGQRYRRLVYGHPCPITPGTIVGMVDGHTTVTRPGDHLLWTHDERLQTYPMVMNETTFKSSFGELAGKSGVWRDGRPGTIMVYTPRGKFDLWSDDNQTRLGYGDLNDRIVIERSEDGTLIAAYIVPRGKLHDLFIPDKVGTKKGAKPKG